MYMDSVEQIRQHLGYTQAHMAQAIGTTAANYSRLLHGTRRPGVELLGRIVRAFPILERATWDYVRGTASLAPECLKSSSGERKARRSKGVSR